MKTMRCSLCALCFLLTPALEAHLPEAHATYPKNILFVQPIVPASRVKPFLAAQAFPVARYCTGFKQKSSPFSKPLKLRFQLGKYMFLHLSYN